MITSTGPCRASALGSTSDPVGAPGDPHRGHDGSRHHVGVTAAAYVPYMRFSIPNRLARRGDADGPVVYERVDIACDRLARRGWPKDLQRVRRVLPEHLHDSPPTGLARHGLWIVVAKSGRNPVGVAWAVHSAGDVRGAYVEEVAVLARYQRQGIGGSLLRELARWMVELDRPHLSILPVTGSHWVVQAGFRVEADSRTYIADASAIASQLES